MTAVVVPVLLLAVLPACSGARADRSTTGSNGANGTAAGGRAPTTSAAGRDVVGGNGAGSRTTAPPATSGSSRTTAPTGSAGSGSASGPPQGNQSSSPSPRPAPAPASSDFAGANGPVGSFARTILRPGPATSVLTEVMAQSGAAPGSSVRAHLQSVLQDATGGKTIATRDTTISGGARSWSQSDLTNTADADTAVHQGANGTAVIHLLYLHGDYGGDQSVLGVAVRGDVLAVFVDRVSDASTVAVPAGELEDAVTIHEAGHVLGLVDLVLHTGRQDPDHPGHSPDRDSVMYWAVDSDLVSQLLDGGPSRDFNDADRRDLATIRTGG